MSAARQNFHLELVELGKNEARVTDGIDADVVTASMCGASGKLELDPDEASMRRTNRESCWLGEDSEVRLHSALHQSAHSKTRVFLVSNRRDNDLSRQFAARCVGSEYG